MPPNIKHTILANMNVKVYWLTTYVSQGSAPTDLRGGGSFNFSFFRRAFLNLTVRKLRKSVHC